MPGSPFIQSCVRDNSASRPIAPPAQMEKINGQTEIAAG
jgi:hypothetical protein